MQTALERVLGECARVGPGPMCRCGAPLVKHDIDGKRVEDWRDAHGTLWGRDELCGGFQPV